MGSLQDRGRAGVRKFFSYFAVQTVNYVILVYNIRMIAAGNVPAALITDAFYASFLFYQIHRISHDKRTWGAFFGFVAGSVAGTFIGMQVKPL